MVKAEIMAFSILIKSINAVPFIGIPGTFNALPGAVKLRGNLLPVVCKITAEFIGRGRAAYIKGVGFGLT